MYKGEDFTTVRHAVYLYLMNENTVVDEDELTPHDVYSVIYEIAKKLKEDDKPFSVPV